jgi:hypothetical protein
MMWHPSLQEIMDFSTGNFDKKNPPYGYFYPHVQLHQSAILDMLIWILLFWLGFFGWFFLLGFFLLNHCENNIIWAMTLNIYII